MKVKTECSFLNPESVKKVEEKYNAKYVLESCVKLRTGDWANFPTAIFYTEKAHPQGSNYFALYYDGSDLMITDGLSAVQDVIFEGLEAEGEVIYSRYRWDSRGGKNGAFVDGGRDYFRFGGDSFNDYNRVKFRVIEGQINFIDGENNV
jgi:hypothetical protein